MCSVLLYLFFPVLLFLYRPGDIAQLARAVALQAIGQGFESPYLHVGCFLKLIGKGRRRWIRSSIHLHQEVIIS